jgi:hypothetical protein
VVIVVVSQCLSLQTNTKARLSSTQTRPVFQSKSPISTRFATLGQIDALTAPMSVSTHRSYLGGVGKEVTKSANGKLSSLIAKSSENLKPNLTTTANNYLNLTILKRKQNERDALVLTRNESIRKAISIWSKYLLSNTNVAIYNQINRLSPSPV